MAFKPKLQDEKEPALFRCGKCVTGRGNSKHDTSEAESPCLLLGTHWPVWQELSEGAWMRVVWKEVSKILPDLVGHGKESR